MVYLLMLRSNIKSIFRIFKKVDTQSVIRNCLRHEPVMAQDSDYKCLCEVFNDLTEVVEF